MQIALFHYAFIISYSSLQGPAIAGDNIQVGLSTYHTVNVTRVVALYNYVERI